MRRLSAACKARVAGHLGRCILLLRRDFFGRKRGNLIIFDQPEIS